MWLCHHVTSCTPWTLTRLLLLQPRGRRQHLLCWPPLTCAAGASPGVMVSFGCRAVLFFSDRPQLVTLVKTCHRLAGTGALLVTGDASTAVSLAMLHAKPAGYE
jgi:hypothetical protein